jgi:hypothetical protein
MTYLLDQLRERYEEYAFFLNNKKSIWELRCYRNHREQWRLRGLKAEILKEVRYLLSVNDGA